MSLPSSRKIWDIAWPIMLSLVAQNIVNVTDTAFLGRVGEVELGASAIGGLLYTTLFMVGFGFTTGVQILVARRNGEKNYLAIGRIFDNSFYFLGITSLVITLVVIFFGPALLKPFMASEAVFKASSTFLVYRVLGLFFASAGLLFRSFYTGIAFTKYLSISSAIMAGVNVILDYALIFGHWGFPRLGIQGAGIASSISEVCALLFFVFITWRNPRLKQYILFKLLKPDFEIIKSTLGISVFVMFQYVFSLGSWFVFFMFIEKMGERSLAVSNIIRSLYLMLMIPGWALCSVTSTLVSNALGEGKPFLVLPIIKKIMKFSIAAMVITVSLAALFPRQAISVYTNDLSLIEATVPSYYIILAATFLFMAMSILFNGVLGTANTKFALGIEMITLVTYLTCAWLFAVKLQLKIEYVWTAEFVYSTLIGILSYWYLKKGNWRSKVV
ncbi:MAG: MATE family efflux transporter [Bacteroidia bacterium]|nr:MATE family efflux transporter [Bacteroidia bacterium]